MQFSYKIENYYQYESRVFVIYTPVDTAFEPLGGWVYIAPEWTEAQIKDAVIAAAPLDKWMAAVSDSALLLIGTEDSGTASLPQSPPPPSLLELKVAKNTQINQWRATANQTTFPHAGKLVACDALSRSDIDAVANSIALTGSFPVGFPGAWKATDNTYIMLPDVDAFKAMHASMTMQGTVNFGRSQTLKADLAAATTVEQVNAITWES